MVVDVNILRMVKDDQLGSYELRFYVIIISNRFFYRSGEGSSVAFRTRQFQELQ